MMDGMGYFSGLSFSCSSGIMLPCSQKNGIKTAGGLSELPFILKSSPVVSFQFSQVPPLLKGLAIDLKTALVESDRTSYKD